MSGVRNIIDPRNLPTLYTRDLQQIHPTVTTNHLRDIGRTSVILDNNVFSYEIIASNPDRSLVIPVVILDEKEGGLPRIYKKIKETTHPMVFTVVPCRKKSHDDPSIAGFEIQRISQTTTAPTDKTPQNIFSQRVAEQKNKFLNAAKKYGDINNPGDKGNNGKLEADFATAFARYKLEGRSDAIIIQNLATLAYIKVIFAMNEEERETEMVEFEKPDSKILNDTTLIVYCLMLECGIYSNDGKVKDMATLCEVPFYNDNGKCENFPEIDSLNLRNI